MLRKACFLFLAATLHLPAASFRNLGFEGVAFPFPVTPETPEFFAPGSQAVPGWDGIIVQHIAVNSSPPGSGFVTLRAWRPEIVELYHFEGTFHLLVSMGMGDDSIYPISQRGTVPSDAGYLEFVTYGAPWTVTLDGETVPLTRELLYDPNPTYRTYRNVGSIATFAGREVELRLSPVRSGETHYHGIGGIKFLPVPEPATLALVGLGGLLLLVRRRI